jgi:DNA-binding NtrC family response regulator
MFVDDEPHVTEGLKRALRREPYSVLSANSASEALDILKREPVDVVVSDEKMPGMSGADFLAVVRQKYPDTIRIILTGHATLDAAIHAINGGEIYRFLTKPCNEVDLSVTIRQALEQKELVSESRRLLKKVRHQSVLLEELEKEHPGITRVRRTINGTIVLEGSDSDLEALIKQMGAEVKRCEAFFRDSE